MASRARAALGLLLAALLWLGASPQLLATAGPGGTLPLPASEEGCQQRDCGGVHIPFPFGNGAEHCHLPGLQIECRDTGNGVFKPFLGNGSTVEVLDVSLSSGQARVLNNVSYYCYNTSSGKMVDSTWEWSLNGSLYTFSDTENKFTVVGCRTLAYIGDTKGGDEDMYQTGCVAMCRPAGDNLTRALKDNGSCSGRGCCQTAIPTSLQYYQVWFDSRLNTSEIQRETPCSFAVLMESSNFTFSPSYVTPSSALRDRLVPVVLDWTVGREVCAVARTKPDYACVSSNHDCIDTAGGRGYICKCKDGFPGNPYLRGGCQDIDECRDRNPCFGECTNTEGGFTCSCPAGTQGNASLENGCQKDPFTRENLLAVGICAGLVVALVAFLAFEVCRKQRSNKRQGYFEQHGGKMLSRILETEGINFTFYKRGDIEKATRHFKSDGIVGEGAHGTVYEGVISVGDIAAATVAVKRCKQLDQSRTEEFVQELVILCRVNHPNVVKLLGCCLHFEAPVLVYEFAPNGTLNDLIHGKPRRRVALATRLRIAAEAAEALAHLHSPPHPTLHGDVKPENILLGEGWVAKVSDFGCSTLDDNVQVVPKGTLAYLAPEFLQDFQITEKTDVYSLGVVLMEVLTGKKPPSKGQKNLRIIFQESMANGTLDKLLDADIIFGEQGANMRVIRQAAELASRCTAVPATTRPAMGYVAEELRRLSNEIPERSLALQSLERSPGYSYADAVVESETTAFYGGVGSIPALNTELAR